MEMEIVGSNVSLLAGTASPEGIEENNRNDRDWRVGAGISVDDSDMSERAVGRVERVFRASSTVGVGAG